MAIINPTAEIIQFQKRQEAKFICSACGADRACDCNAPALEREAAKRELHRQASAKHRRKKRQQKQQSRDITVEDDLEVDEYREAFLLRTADALSFAVYSGDIDREVIAAAKRVAAKWEKFAQTLEVRYGNEA